MTGESTPRPMKRAGHPFAVALLAAGGARRFGSQKLLAPLGGVPLLWHALDALAALPEAEVCYLVTGGSAGEVEACYHAWLAARGARPFVILRNLDWEEGLSSSLRVAAQAVFGTPATGESTRVRPWMLVVLGDQPCVSAAHLKGLVHERNEALARGELLRAVASGYCGRNAVPALLAPCLAPTLAGLLGDSGAREILNGPHAGVRARPLAGAWLDVDTAADLARLETLKGTPGGVGDL